MPTLTAVASSASGRITLADLPPSSSVTRLSVAAAISATRRPAAAEPVKETVAMPGWAAMASPVTGPVPLTRLKTPGGSPMASKMSASS